MRRRLKTGTLLLAGMLLSTDVAAKPPQDEDAQTMGSREAAHRNRLADATSPYLQQHANNPVDWYAWGPAALSQAREQDKPIFLSIGYSACHWCHVMAHESFEDADIAAVMNANFVNIKVDREERPDLDEIYMQATLVLNQGQGGWPMSVWLTPDLKPFFAGTYFPPTSRWGRPGFKEVCERIGEAWREDRGRILEGATRLAEIVQEGLRAKGGDGDALSLKTIDQAADTLAGAFDEECGGLSSGSPNKFPPSMAMDIMLRSALQRDAEDPQRKRLLDLVRLTLDRMATGGIYDQLGGGFHRYSTDRCWHVPHFEKMLYDQALITDIYLDGWQVFGSAMYECIIRETLDYVLRDLQSPDGGFYSTRDADSEGEEGKYYVWTRDEVLELLGAEEGQLVANYFDITESGNWQDPHHPGAEKSIPRVLRDKEVCAKLHGVESGDCHARLLDGRARLLAARQQRTPPARDEKILCEWNGLMIASLARSGSALGEPRYVEAASRAADFILAHQYRDGRLLRSYRDGRTLDTAFLSDYACFIEGLLELYEATQERRWLDHAAQLNAKARELFWDDAHGGYFFTADDHEKLLARTKDVRDNAVPSGNSVQLMNLLRLSVMLGDDALRKQAEQMMHTFAQEVRRAPWAAERFLAAVEFALRGPVEVAVVGPAEHEDTRELLSTVHKAYLPNRVLMLRDPAAAKPLDVPLLENRPQLDGRPTAYVCRDYTCKQPVTESAALREQLEAR